MPLASRTFGDLITFTRGSTGSYFDAAGVLQSAAIDVPRFDYDPATLLPRGFLLEEARTNLLTRSAEFNVAAGGWNSVVRLSVTPDTTAAPDGTSTADSLVIDTTASTNHSISQTVSLTAGTTYTISVFAKANQITQINLRFSANTLSGSTSFDLLTGAKLNAGTVGASENVPIGNGWYRCSFTTTANATGSANAQIFLATSSGSITFPTANGTDSVWVWGAQLEVGAFPTSYIPTTTTALPRSADVARINTLSPWFNASASAVFAQFDGPPVLSTGPSRNNIVEFSDASTNNNMRVFCFLADITVVSANSAASAINAGRITAGGAYTGALTRAAAAFANGSRALVANGGAVTVSAEGVFPVPITYMGLGSDGSAANLLNGHLQRVTYYPIRLTNTDLQAITV